MALPNGYGSGSTVTPEAVLLDFELAGVGSRSIAICIDIIIQFAALFAFALVAGIVGAGSEVAGLIVLLVGLIGAILGYSVLMETMNGGKTLGRAVVGTRVVTIEGAPVRFRQSLIRSLLAIIDIYASFGGVAVVSALMTRRGQRLGDLVAGTMVIRERSSAGLAGAVYFWPPGHLVVWSQALDASGLGNDGYQLIRDFLTRPDLAEPHRTTVAEDLAQLVGERLPHATRPAGVSAFDYLTAVAAAAQAPNLGTASPGRPPPPAPRPGARPLGGMPPPPGAVSGAMPPPPAPRPGARPLGGMAAPPPVARPSPSRQDGFVPPG